MTMSNSVKKRRTFEIRYKTPYHYITGVPLYHYAHSGANSSISCHCTMFRPVRLQCDGIVVRATMGASPY